MNDYLLAPGGHATTAYNDLEFVRGIECSHTEAFEALRADHENYHALADRLRSIGGSRLVVGPDSVFDFPLLLDCGRLFTGIVRRLPPGPGNCHQNAAAGIVNGDIGTGFALAGIVWYPHSWLVVGNGITETTEQGYERYYGAQLDPENEARFRARLA